MNSVLSLTDSTAAPASCDTIIIELHETLSPYSVLAADTIIVKTNGEGMSEFPSLLFNGATVFIAIRGNNIVETWSKQPITLSSFISFDFTTN